MRPNAYRHYFSAFPDVVMDIEVNDVIVDASRIVVSAPFRFIHSSPLFGVAPSGARVEVRTFVIIFTFAGEKVIHERRLYDSQSVHGMLSNILVDRELKAAAEVQRALLPRQRVARGYCDVAGAAISCRMIGGDFFEHVELPSGGVGIALGDVSGKGSPR